MGTLLLVGVPGLCPVPAYAQVLAHTPTSTYAQSQGSVIHLRDALLKLRELYKVDILFEEKQVENFNIDARVIDNNLSIERNLDLLLRPSGLVYKKTSKNAFLIVAPRKDKKATTSEKSASATGTSFEGNTSNAVINVSKVNVSAREAQVVKISGRVTDENNGGIPGVSVVLKGTTTGTVTDIEGKYALNVPDENAQTGVLVFSAIGYVTEELPLKGQTELNLKMLSDIKALAEVVVVGYGKQQKKDLTGVVTAVDSKSFNKGAIASADQLIVGKVAGVQITSNNGGEPGGQSSIRIRGGTSITASNEPLYVIDGVPIDNSAIDPGGFSSGRNPLNFLNPNDIESFTVLKDASAAAIYGSRGANGVIIITTKKGSGGLQPSVSYDGWYSIGQIAKSPDLLNADEFRKAVSDKEPGKLSELKNANTNWVDEVTQQAIGSSHSLTFMGGTDKLNYRASIGRQDQDGIMHNTNMKRTNLAFSYGHRLLNDKLNVNANIKLAHTADQFAPGIGNSISFAPTQPIRDANSPWAGYWEWDNVLAPKNPVAEMNLRKEVGKNLRGIGNIQLDYQLPFVKGLSANLNLGFDASGGNRKLFMPNNLRSQFSNKGEVRVESFLRTSILMESYLNYKKDLKGIFSKIDVTAGYSYQDFSAEYPGYRAWELTSNFLEFNSTAAAKQNQTFNSVEESRLISFFGRANYSFKDKYLLTLTVRQDGSARFGPSYRWATFPSAAFAWRVIDEPFMGSIRNVLSDLKFRVGYGLVGSQEIGNYRYFRTYTYGDNLSQYQLGDTFYTTIRPNGVDPNLKWEETSSWNIGADYGFLNGRITGSIEYYYKQTKDLLFEVTVPAGSNLTNIVLTNIGKVENKGLEFAVDAHVISKPKFNWTVGFNLALNQNQILGLDRLNDPNFKGYEVGGISGGTGNKVQLLKVGQVVNAFYVYEQKMDANGKPLVDGVDHNEDEKIDLADMYADTNNDGVVNPDDRRAYQSPAPKAILGFTSQLTFHSFDLNFTLRSNLGNYVYNNVASNTGFYNRLNDVPQNMTRSVLETNFRQAQYFSDYYVENASFLRMDNISLGYTVKPLSSKLKLRVYGTIQNAFVLTNYSGLDPEVGGKVTQGIDNNLYPRARTYTFGLNVTF